MQSHVYKAPRLYVTQPMEAGGSIGLSPEQAHYLKNVLRRDIGADLRIFNGHDGEFLAEIEAIDKKVCRVSLKEKLIEQHAHQSVVRLYFAPPKKSRLDFLVEKAVELGVSSLHPVFTSRTENRKLNAERIQKQIIEASEQCERLDLPEFNAPIRLHELPEDHNILWCAERADADLLGDIQGRDWAFIVGPEGGFDGQELTFLQDRKNLIPVSLGANILRAETASLMCLSYAAAQKRQG